MKNMIEVIWRLQAKTRVKTTVFFLFAEDDRVAVAELRQARFEARLDSDSESDISVSAVATEDISDFADSDEEEETWNENANPVDVSPFTVATGPTSGVAEDGTAIDFFHLRFPEELIEQIVPETNRFARQCIAAKPDPEWFDTSLEEVKAFLGLQVFFGIKQLPAIRLYWSSDPLKKSLRQIIEIFSSQQQCESSPCTRQAFQSAPRS